MSEFEGVNEANTEAQPEERVVMTIILTKEGGMKVSTPLLMDRMACFGILEEAKQRIVEHHKEMTKKLVEPTHRIIDFMRNKRS